MVADRAGWGVTVLRPDRPVVGSSSTTSFKNPGWLPGAGGDAPAGGASPPVTGDRAAGPVCVSRRPKTTTVSKRTVTDCPIGSAAYRDRVAHSTADLRHGRSRGHGVVWPVIRPSFLGRLRVSGADYGRQR